MQDFAGTSYDRSVLNVNIPIRRFAIALAAFIALSAAGRAQNQPLKASATGEVPPRTWVDKDTGHRVWRMTDEPGSGGFYFNVNAYTPDLKTMIYTAPDGIHGLDLATKKTWLIVPNPTRSEGENGPSSRFGGVHAIVAGHKTNSVFFSKADPATHVITLYKADVYTKQVTKLCDLPKGMSVATVYPKLARELLPVEVELVDVLIVGLQRKIFLDLQWM